MSNTQRLIRSVLAGVFAALALMGTAHAQEARQPEAPTHTWPPLTNPASASWGPDRVNCFVYRQRIVRCITRIRTWPPAVTTAISRRGSRNPVSPPVRFRPERRPWGVTAWGPGRLDIMAIDEQRRSWMHRLLQTPTPGGQSDWESLGFPGVEMTEIGCSSWGVNRIDCFRTAAPIVASIRSAGTAGTGFFGEHGAFADRHLRRYSLPRHRSRGLSYRYSGSWSLLRWMATSTTASGTAQVGRLGPMAASLRATA